MTIRQINEWFKKATPNPDNKNLSVQLGCHLEELDEMLGRFNGADDESRGALLYLRTAVKQIADEFKAGDLTVQVLTDDRIELLDGLCDQIVTAVGIANYLGMDIVNGLKEVADSNDSKFENGQPVRNEAGSKILKGKNYVAPDLRAFV